MDIVIAILFPSLNGLNTVVIEPARGETHVLALENSAYLDQTVQVCSLVLAYVDHFSKSTTANS